jgi:alkanesulfonate monooxygenase SsuD/methylene tetrahydromethanopterin reductase-like flavin-dependent oxidoreductase (luciferase family)
LRPPILIGGGGERNTRRLVARYADACDPVASSLEDVAPKLDVLRTHCRADARDYDTMPVGRRTIKSMHAATTSTVLAIFVIAPLGALAVDRLLFDNWIWHIDVENSRNA